MSEHMTTEKLAEETLRGLKEMPSEEKAKLREHLDKEGIGGRMKTFQEEIKRLIVGGRMPTLVELSAAVLEARRTYANQIRRARRERRPYTN
jgi:hypothetical protein